MIPYLLVGLSSFAVGLAGQAYGWPEATAALAAGAAALVVAAFLLDEPPGRDHVGILALAVVAASAAAWAGTPWAVPLLVALLLTARWARVLHADLERETLDLVAEGGEARAAILDERGRAEGEREEWTAALRDLTNRYEMVRTIGSSLRFNETLKHIAEGSLRLAGSTVELYVAPGEGVVAGYFRGGSDKPFETPAARPDAWAEALAGRAVRSGGNGPADVWLPLRSRGETMGALHLRTDAPEEALGILARQTAMALHKIRLYAAVLRQSETDLLTELPHQARFKAALAEEVERAGRAGRVFTLVMVDIDHFKAVNDTHGHRAGDAVLVAVSRLLRGAVRDVDFVARYGGEEFAILLPETGIEGAGLFAERARRRVEEHRIPIRGEEGGDRLLAVTISIGAASFPLHADRPETLLAAADAALYRAKREGRNRFVAAPSPGA